MSIRGLWMFMTKKKLLLDPSMCCLALLLLLFLLGWIGMNIPVSSAWDDLASDISLRQSMRCGDDFHDFVLLFVIDLIEILFDASG